jgi:hypothetical protein
MGNFFLGNTFLSPSAFIARLCSICFQFSLLLSRHFSFCSLSCLTPFHETRFPHNQPRWREKWIGCHYFSARSTALIIQLVIRKPSSLFQSVPLPSCFTIWPCYLPLLGASSPVGLAVSTIFSSQTFPQHLRLLSPLIKKTNNLTFIGPCIADVFPSITNKMQFYTIYLIIYFCEMLYMFQAVPPLIIMSSKLYIQHRLPLLAVSGRQQ